MVYYIIGTNYSWANPLMLALVHYISYLIVTKLIDPTAKYMASVNARALVNLITLFIYTQ